jgi:hypothetical protein
MDNETLKELRRLLSAHANVVTTEVTLAKMKLANDESRSHGKKDVYTVDDFHMLEIGVAEYAKSIAG